MFRPPATKLLLFHNFSVPDFPPTETLVVNYVFKE